MHNAQFIPLFFVSKKGKKLYAIIDKQKILWYNR